MNRIISTIDCPPLAFAIGGPEILVLLVLLAIPVGIVVVLVIVRATRSTGPAPSLPIPRPADERIRELDALLENKLITHEEYQQRRNEILSTV
jgi:hypothetical protein